MKHLKTISTKKHLLAIAAVCLATAACTSSVKDNKDNTLTTDEEITEVTGNGISERAGTLLPRKDSLSLAKLYHDYEKAVNDLRDHSIIRDEEYDRKRRKIKTDFEKTLTGNPHYAPVVELRNLLIAYENEKKKDEEHMYDVDLKLDEDMPEEFVTHEQEMHFLDRWKEKLVRLLKDHPGFMECPPYMFEEAIEDGFNVATSADGRLRIYSNPAYEWRGVTYVTCIRQYRADNGQVIAALVREHSTSWGIVDKIHSLTVDGKTVYLEEMVHNEIFLYFTYHAEAIEGDTITHPVIFDTEDNKDPYVLYNLNGPEKDWVAKYDEKKRTIYMRVTDIDNKYYLYDDYVTYTFDGKMFKFSGRHKE